MTKTLIKFKHIEDMSENDYIEAIYPDDPLETIQLIKEIGTIKLKDDWYYYEFCEFIPSVGREFPNVILVCVDGDDDYLFNK